MDGQGRVTDMTSKWVAPNGAVTFDWHRSKDWNTGKVTETRSP